MVDRGRGGRDPYAGPARPESDDGRRTTDDQIIAAADVEGRAVVTKDADFVDSHILHGRPAKLLLISTGNISNRDLEKLVIPLLPAITLAFAAHSFLELDHPGITIRG